jgi:hypothetical protein
VPCGKGYGYAYDNDNDNDNDNGIVELIFGSLKYESLNNIIHLTRERIINHVNRYSNGINVHATLDYQNLNEYENHLINVCH